MADLNTALKAVSSGPMPVLDGAKVEGAPQETPGAKTAPPSAVATAVKEVAQASGPLGKADAQTPGLLPCAAKPVPEKPKVKKKAVITYNQPAALTYPAPLTDKAHFTATCSSKLPVKYSIDSSGPPPRPPSVTIVATCPGNDEWEDAPPRSVTIAVKKGKQTIAFEPVKTKFPYGTKLSEVLNATVNEEGGGRISYESPLGTALDPAKIPDCPKISVTPKAGESDLYLAATGKPVIFTVEPLEYEIEWNPVGPFTHQVKLGEIFNATVKPAHDDIQIIYSAKAATTFAAGKQSISVTVKSPNKNYVAKPKQFVIDVLKAPQAIAWGKIADFAYGPEVPAENVQLAHNKTASGGKITYRVQKAGEAEMAFVPRMVLSAGTYVMTAYAAETLTHLATDAKSEPFRINKKAQTVEWDPLPKIQVGSGLSEGDKTARVAGNAAPDLVYTPQGEPPVAKEAGPQKFLVEVTAKASENYLPSKARVFKLDVVKGQRTVKWNKPNLGQIQHGVEFNPTIADVTVEPPVDAKRLHFSVPNFSPGPNGIYVTIGADRLYDACDARAELTVIDYPQDVTYKPTTIRYKETLTSKHLNAVINEGNTKDGLVYAVPEGRYPNGSTAEPPAVGSPAFEIQGTIKAGSYFKAWSGVAAKVTVVRAVPELVWTPPAAIMEGTATPFPNPTFNAGKGEVSPGCWEVPDASKLKGGSLTVTATSKVSTNYEAGSITAPVMVVGKTDTKAMSKGHAWDKHVLGNNGGRADWNPAPATEADFDTIIQDVVTQAVANGDCKVKGGKGYFWSNGRIVILDPSTDDKGTCFKPNGPGATGGQGKRYYDDK